MGWAIEYDDDGYPEDECLEALKAAPLDFPRAARFIVDVLGVGNPHSMASVCDARDGFTEAPVKNVTFSTGGWSGNEDLIGIATSRFDVSHFLHQWNAGGHYQFQVPLAMLEMEPMTTGTPLS